MTLQVYTDGAFTSAGAVGGWAWWLSDNHWASGSEVGTTNNRMEMLAMLEAMLAFYYVDEQVEFISDSQYVINTITKRWWVTWEANDWHTAGGTPVANQDLWRRIQCGLYLYYQRPKKKRPHFLWVKGHRGNYGNEQADRLAGEAKLRRINEGC